MFSNIVTNENDSIKGFIAGIVSLAYTAVNKFVNRILLNISSDVLLFHLYI